MARKVDDKELLRRCLNHETGAWRAFVDQYLALIYRVIHYTAHLRSQRLSPEDVEDLAAEVLMQIVAGDYKLLRQFQGHSRFSTYLTVVARRICVHLMSKRQPKVVASAALEGQAAPNAAPDASLETLDEVHKLLARLPKKAREIVRLHYLEGRSYEDISAIANVPVNSIGPILSRAMQVLRNMMQSRLQAKQAVGK